MPKGGLEPPRAITLTWPSTMRVYQIPPLRQNEDLWVIFLNLILAFLSLRLAFLRLSPAGSFLPGL